MAFIKEETPLFEETFQGEIAVDVKEEIPEFEEIKENVNVCIKEEENEESADIGFAMPRNSPRLEDVKAGLRRIFFLAPNSCDSRCGRGKARPGSPAPAPANPGLFGPPRPRFLQAKNRGLKY